MEPRTTSDPSKPAVAPPLRKSVDADELPLAWPALVDEVQALHRRGQLMAFQPQWMLAEVRRGAAKALPPPDQAIRLTVKAQSLFQKQKGLGELAAELHLLLPVGYPILPPLESCGGDVEVNMVGLASKRTMKALGRELHLHLLRVYEANCGALPRYVAEAIKWVEGRDVIDLVAAMAAPQHPKVGKSRSRAFVRFHHIESHVKIAYGLRWGAELDIGGYIGKGQPGMVCAEGDTECLAKWVDRFTTVLHWGPIPCAVVAMVPTLATDPAPPLPPLAELSTALPACVRAGGAFNGRNCIDFLLLQQTLAGLGHESCAAHLQELLPVYAHEGGHVDDEGREAALEGAAQREADKRQVQEQADPGAMKRKGRAKKRLQ